MHHRNTVAFIAALLIVLSQSAAADRATDWNSGQEAFHRGEYANALRSFQSAKNSGLDSPAVYYNIAVCQFKLGDFEQAEKGFTLLGQRFPQMRGLAEYNLGLTARRLGDAITARQHFLRAYELSPDNEKLRILSSRMLAETVPVLPTESAWTGAIGARVGNDDNVALRDDLGLPAGTSKESAMADIFASIRSPGKGTSSVRLEGSGYLVRYFDADDFDQAEIRGRIFYDWRPDDWRIELSAHASAGTLGGNAFDRKTGGSVRIARYLGNTTLIDLRYAYDDVSDQDLIFAGIRGSREQLDAKLRWYANGHRFILGYLSEKNDRADPGVSPTRDGLRADYRYAPESGWGYEAGIYSRNSEFDDLAIPRKEELRTVRAALTYAMSSNWIVLLDYRYSENDSSDVTFSYDRSQIALGILKVW
jgi:hypothetical protein